MEKGKVGVNNLDGNPPERVRFVRFNQEKRGRAWAMKKPDSLREVIKL